MRKKISSHISFPDELDLSPYMTKTDCDDQVHKYSLFAVISHFGSSVETGHYLCYVKLQFHDRWSRLFFMKNTSELIEESFSQTNILGFAVMITTLVKFLWKKFSKVNGENIFASLLVFQRKKNLKETKARETICFVFLQLSSILSTSHRRLNMLTRSIVIVVDLQPGMLVIPKSPESVYSLSFSLASYSISDRSILVFVCILMIRSVLLNNDKRTQKSTFLSLTNVFLSLFMSVCTHDELIHFSSFR